jgi:hypothetical protein
MVDELAKQGTSMMQVANRLVYYLLHTDFLPASRMFRACFLLGVFFNAED